MLSNSISILQISQYVSGTPIVIPVGTSLFDMYPGAGGVSQLCQVSHGIGLWRPLLAFG